jgi:Predicted O-methyltransferase
MKLPGVNDIPAQTPLEWEKLFRNESSRAAGQDLYPEIFANSYLMPLQRKAEMRKMLAKARMVSPSVVMEIGSDKGGGFYHWVKAFLPSKAIAIEYRGVPFAPAFESAFPSTKFLCIEGSSYDTKTVNRVQEFLGTSQIDCLFIDGDKSAFNKDVAAYLPFMRSGGLILLHDVQDVKNAQETMATYAKQFRTETILDTSEYDAIQEREKGGLPPIDAYEGWFRVWKRTSCGVGIIHVR